MLAFNFLSRRIHAAITSVVLFAATGGLSVSWAQAAPSITDADIERARRSQPTISDKEIERARNRYRTPSDLELSRVPIPSAPNLDALPQPKTSHPIDLEALAKGYEANADRIAAAQSLHSGPALMVFISFSMPQPTLQRLVDQAAKAQAALVIRGLVNGSLRDTVVRAQQLIGERKVAFQVDPQAFDRFAVTVTPTFVLVRDGAQSSPCNAGLCYASDAFVATAGDVSLDYALEYVERRSPRFARDAQRFLKKLRG
ncbi:type-F conjugative transfer system pilin assembly protein TrbC [Herbaspirillum sp. ST 5-3]|uniref:type-F conjugative transfer system pilin assembly protein TrbC n=1 Tax=Oxalobacteraceae TaxID=75682 RepID=UPI001FFEE4DA|nr:type-F conjugative transfer system pilin assembly protein TrbC [Herbaspirillum sp. ST 5-3]